MSEPRLDFVTCASPAGMHRMAYWEWGDPANDAVVVCVHGLTRTGRDFDVLARRLSGRYRVVCPDVVGRGRSDWLANPAFYTVPQYVADMTTLLARLRPATLHWVGTSMGGLIGMALGGALQAKAAAGDNVAGLLADTARRDPVFARLVLNDVGPRIEPAALARIALYVGQPVAFATYEQAVQYVRAVSEGFGPHDDEQWDALTRHIFRRQDGMWVKHYDTGLAVPFSVQDPAALVAGEQLLWHAYETIDCPILLVRGAESDLLSTATAQEMLARNRRARLVEFAGVGHAPTLMAADQVQAVEDFLRG